MMTRCRVSCTDSHRATVIVELDTRGKLVGPSGQRCVIVAHTNDVWARWLGKGSLRVVSKLWMPRGVSQCLRRSLSFRIRAYRTQQERVPSVFTSHPIDAATRLARRNKCLYVM